MAKQYVNGRWVTVVDKTTGSTATNASTGSALPQRETPTAIESTSSGGADDGKSSSSEEQYDEVAYDIIEGSVSVTKADMGIKCHSGVKLSGVGKVFSTTYLVTGVKISLNATAMKQVVTLHKDSLGTKKKKVVVKQAESRPQPVSAPKKSRTYTVKRGDCLYKIAKNELGNASRWREIYNMNKGVIGGNPNLIYAGQVYTLPD